MNLNIWSKYIKNLKLIAYQIVLTSIYRIDFNLQKILRIKIRLLKKEELISVILIIFVYGISFGNKFFMIKDEYLAKIEELIQLFFL